MADDTELIDNTGRAEETDLNALEHSVCMRIWSWPLLVLTAVACNEPPSWNRPLHAIQALDAMGVEYVCAKVQEGDMIIDQVGRPITCMERPYCAAGWGHASICMAGHASTPAS